MRVSLSSALLAPGVPPDYYRRIFDAEQGHWWHLGMREISRVLLGKRLQAGVRVLDAGCGTGGVLRWLIDEGRVGRAVGVDVASAAIDLARERVPEAELHVAPVRALPLEDESFDLVVSNDVLQHVFDHEVVESLRELRRVLAPGGALLLRTNGARKLRRERGDWRAYDRGMLAAVLEQAGFSCERLTYANAFPSAWALLTRRTPHAPTEQSHGIARQVPSGMKHLVGLRLLRAEARFLRRPGRSLPFGHTLFALASPR